MTFSKFAKIMCPYCNNGSNPEDFVVLFTNKIMGGRPARAHKDGTFQNPLMSKEPRTRLAYFNGERAISKRDASIIFSSIDKYKFETFLRKYCSDDAIKRLKRDISEATNVDYNRDIVEVCADLFQDILYDLAKA